MGGGGGGGLRMFIARLGKHVPKFKKLFVFVHKNLQSTDYKLHKFTSHFSCLKRYVKTYMYFVTKYNLSSKIKVVEFYLNVIIIDFFNLKLCKGAFNYKLQAKPCNLQIENPCFKLTLQGDYEKIKVHVS